MLQRMRPLSGSCQVYQRIRVRMTNSRPDGYKDFVAILLLHQTFAAKDILNAITEIGPDVVTGRTDSQAPVSIRSFAGNAGS